MIKFNTYPPQQAGDAEFTDGARELISERRHITIKDEVCYDRSPVRLFAYGESIGQTLLAATNNDTVLANRIATPLIRESYELRDSVDRNEAAALGNGIYSTFLKVNHHDLVA